MTRWEPDKIRELADQLTASAAAWAASVPDALDPVTGQAAAQRALDDSSDVLRTLVGMMAGTVPPAPWPAPPALQAARKRVRTLRDGFAVFERKVPGARWPRDSGKLGPVLLREGRALYRELRAFLEYAGNLPTYRNLPGFGGFGALAVGLGLAWFFRRELGALLGGNRRARRRAFT